MEISGGNVRGALVRDLHGIRQCSKRLGKLVMLRIVSNSFRHPNSENIQEGLSFSSSHFVKSLYAHTLVTPLIQGSTTHGHRDDCDIFQACALVMYERFKKGIHMNMERIVSGRTIVFDVIKISMASVRVESWVYIERMCAWINISNNYKRRFTVCLSFSMCRCTPPPALFLT